MRGFLAVILLLISTNALALEMPTAPSAGRPESIGKYDNGCIAGALALPDASPNYEIMRPSRHRYYGHNLLLDFLIDFAGKYSVAFGRKLLVGDMGQPRGALMISGHASHQIGLDVDIWFKTLPATQKLTAAEREDVPADFLVDENGVINQQVWQDNNIAGMLKLASGEPQVERIFVNPKIKMALCQSHKGEAWLKKIRPWWQHREHFHVRLYCAQNDPDCVSQAPLPNGDGCDASLAWWDSDDAKLKAAAQKPHPRVFNLEKLPPRCQDLFAQ